MRITNIDYGTEIKRPKSYCDHCGNITYKFIGGRSTVFVTDHKAIEYRLYRCEICTESILIKAVMELSKNYGVRDGKNSRTIDDEEVEQLWPPMLSLNSEAPERVRKIYDEARRVKSQSPSSFVVQIGRALEAVTNDKNAEGRTLYDRLNWLIANEELPQIFGEMGHINRILRNWGAHDAGFDVTKEDVEIVDEFLKAIIEYLYVAPAKVDRIQALLIERKRRDINEV